MWILAFLSACSPVRMCEDNADCLAGERCGSSVQHGTDVCMTVDGPRENDLLVARADEGTNRTGECATLPPLTWFSGQTCGQVGPWELTVFDELVTVWGSFPAGICAYDPTYQPTGACGQVPAGNAAYCPGDGQIYYDAQFIADKAAEHGDFAAVAILAHEWAHMNQHLVLQQAPPPIKAIELQADCQAGVFTAVQQQRGHLDGTDLAEAFAILLQGGDANVVHWSETGHGTGEERIAAFNQGYYSAQINSQLVCGPDPLTAMALICP